MTNLFEMLHAYLNLLISLQEVNKPQIVFDTLQTIWQVFTSSITRCISQEKHKWYFMDFKCKYDYLGWTQISNVGDDIIQNKIWYQDQQNPCKTQSNSWSKVTRVHSANNVTVQWNSPECVAKAAFLLVSSLCVTGPP